MRFSRVVQNFIGKLIIQKMKNFSPAVIVRIDGGLGSQMGQFSLGLSVAHSCGLPVKYDLTWFKENGKDIKGEQNRNFDLPKILPGGFDFTVADEREIALYKRYFFYAPKFPCIYERDVCYGKNPRYLGGYYCNIKYLKPVREKLIKLFAPAPTIKQTITASETSVAVHVRRGDYVGSLHDVTTPKYFIKAAELMCERLSNPTFFIFSNDIEYAKELFAKSAGNFIFIEGNDNDSSYADMHIMRQCKHFVISNSNFSWWPAFLSENPNKIVIAPDKWFRSNSGQQFLYNETAYIDDGWFALPC